MRVPIGWLRAYCDPGLSAREIGDKLTLAGIELERIDRVGVGDTGAFVVGKVLTAEKHPDADRLSVCTVDDGSGDPRTIVCGAPNVAAGQTVALALPGALMPDGTKLGEAELRGVRSSGMILAEDEVGIGEDHAGTMVLPDELPAGAPLVEHLQIADEVLDFEVNPNRPDCLGVYGVAREVHAITGAPLGEDPTAADAEPAGGDGAEQHASVEIDSAICLRFTARVFEQVRIGPAPLWLKARLMAAGQRPISNVVDITNYVMLLTGQPLHAFDLDEVRGQRIVVRRAQQGERMTTLDDVQREFDSDTALVCDADGPSGIAGIMGGQISEMSEKTTRVLMEAATWVGPNILQSSKRLALRTEASARFEKQLHPELAIAAQRLAARLMVELCGARMAPGTIDVYPSPVPERRVGLRPERLQRLLGEEIPGADTIGILERLGFAPEREDGRLEVTVPPWRHSDVEREADLVEEVARVYGLDKLPITLPARQGAVGRLTASQRLRRRLEDALRDRGLHETISWSFTSPEAIQRVRLADIPLLRVANPLSEEQSVMRPLLLVGLLDAARHNSARGRSGAALFESARVYMATHPLDAPEGSPRGATPCEERHHIGGLLAGSDFYAAKGVVDALLSAAGVQWSAEPGPRPFLHPGRAASVLAGDERKLGWIGELHPLVAREWDLKDVAAFELDFDLLHEIVPAEARSYRELSSFPAVIQDIAVVVDEDVAAAEIEEAVRSGAGDLLERLRLFDVYRSDQLGEGRKSIALTMEFRAPDRTLTDEEVAERRDAIEQRLDDIGGRLRA